MLKLTVLTLLAALNGSAVHAAPFANAAALSAVAERDDAPSVDACARRLERASREAWWIEIKRSTTTTCGQRLDDQSVGANESFSRDLYKNASQKVAQPSRLCDFKSQARRLCHRN